MPMARDAHLPNLSRLVILWLLSEGPLHGYQIKRIISDPGLQRWFPIELSSIYSVLRFLQKHRYATQRAERAGRRPPRRRYAITPAGRRYFASLLRDAARYPAQTAQPVDVVVAAGGELPDAELGDLFGERRARLVDHLAFLDRHARSAPSPDMVARARLAALAEIAWLDERGGRRTRSPAPDKKGEQAMATVSRPDVQLISNLIVAKSPSDVLLVKYDASDERWWLPGGDLEPYEHPDEAARRILADLPGLTVESMVLHDVESFRGRRGWHVVFHYLVRAGGEVRGKIPAAWFPALSMPRTMHGRWERSAVERVLDLSGAGART